MERGGEEERRRDSRPWRLDGGKKVNEPPRKPRREDYSKPSPREGAKRKGEAEARAGWRGGYAITR